MITRLCKLRKFAELFIMLRENQRHKVRSTEQTYVIFTVTIFIVVYDSKLLLLVIALKRMMISFDVATEGWWTTNPNSGFANALWDSLEEIQTSDKVRQTSRSFKQKRCQTRITFFVRNLR
jgi:hypothetical protein